MSIPSFFVLLFICWLIFFFIFLPFGIKIPNNHEVGHANSSPEKANIGKKLFFSLICSIFFSIIFLLVLKKYF